MENRAINDGQIWTYSGACFVTMKYVKLDVVFHASAELEPYRDASAFTMTIDGREYNRIAAPAPPGITPTFSLHAACDGDDRQTGGLSLGTHTVSVTWRLAGTTTDLPTATMTVDLSCGADTNPPSSSSGAPTSSTVDGGANGAAPSGIAPAATDDAGGCSTTGRAPFSAGLLAVAALVVVRRGRTRRR